MKSISRVIFLLLLLSLSVNAQQLDPNLYSNLRWRMLGPFRAGRVNAVSGVIGQPDIFYFGSVGGGLWKTQNAGRTWTPIFDSTSVASIGAIAVAPSNTNLIYVGTGEPDMRDSIAFGDGVYKSSDAGKTWQHLGLENTKQIGRIIVDPKNPSTVFVAALGNVYAPNPDRGVYRSHDGGATWQKVLFKNDDLGAIDLAFDPLDSKIVYATLWNVRRPPWFIYAPANGPGAGIYKSIDGGSTWKEISEGIPLEGRGHIGIAVAPTNRNRLYAVVDAKDGGVFTSNDAGATWTRLSSDKRFWDRGWYFEKISIDPKNADVVYVMNTSIYRSTDAGKTWTAIKGAPGGDDYHQLWINPDDPKRMIVASDQGAVVSVDGAVTWSSWYNQPTAQIYHLAADHRFPYWITGAQQDSGAVGTPSRSIHSEISNRDWEGLCAGGEAGYTAPDPLNPKITFGGTVTRCNVETGETRNVTPEVNLPAPARHTWTNPLVFSLADPHALYFGDQFVFKTSDGGGHWTRISDDLTRPNPVDPPNLDAATAADVDANRGKGGVVYTIAPSPLRAPLLWIGTDDGLIKVTQDDGKTWQDVTPRELTPWSKVAMMDASHFDANEAYAAVDRHRLTDNEPYIYRTKDLGRTWQKITRGLPAGVYLQTVKEDPKKRGLLVAGSELGVFISFNDGDDWQSLQLNLPATSNRDLAFKDNDLIVATHGRGFWVLDDISALRQMGPEVTASDAFLFKPSDAIILPPGTDDGTPTQKDEPWAENPPVGAIVDYYIRSAANGPITLEILNAAGAMVRRYSSADPITPIDPNTLVVNAVWQRPQEGLAASAGMHRFVWDFRPAPPAGGRGGRGGGGGGGRGGLPPSAPGSYTVKLTVNGRSLTQALTLRPDPR